MFKVKQKITTILVACLTALFALVLAIGGLFTMPTTTASAAEKSATLTFDNTSKRTTQTTSQQIWTENGITVTNNKGSSTSNIGNYSKPARFYASSEIIIEYSQPMTKIVVDANNSSYATAIKNSTFTNATISVSSDKATITLTTPEKSFKITKLNAQSRVDAITVYYEGGCAHQNKTTETNNATCTDDGNEVVTCDDCGEVVSDTVIPATGHDFADPAYVREGDKHTATGTCKNCGETTEETSDCTLTYENVSNDNGTHNVISTCSVCNQSGTNENVQCTFNRVIEGTNAVYTCKYCEYSYSEPLATFTVTYNVPSGVEAIDPVEVLDTASTELVAADDAISNGIAYTFVGWTTTECETSTTKPNVYETGYKLTVTEDVNLYAVYSFVDASIPGAWTKVTSVDSLAIGDEIIIVASESDHALGADNGNNRLAVAIKKSGDTVTFDSSVQVITLEAGSVDSTFAFNIGNSYLYAASSGSNYLKAQSKIDANASWAITITSAGVATIKAQGSNTRNWLRKNSTSDLFACYSSGQKDVSIYKVMPAICYASSFGVCEHLDTEVEIITPATCTTPGAQRLVCVDCGSQAGEMEEIPALGHEYNNETHLCIRCEKLDPNAIDYSGYFYLSVNGKYAGEKDGKYYKLFDFTPGETIDLNYVFYFVKNGNTYNMYSLAAGLCASNLTMEKQKNDSVHIIDSEGLVLSHNTSYNTYQRLGFYSASNSYPKDITLTPVALSAHIDSATISIGESIALNYYVTMSDEFATAKMTFTAGELSETPDVKKVGDQYVYSFTLAPNQIAELVDAELKFNDVVIASKYDYSVKTYAQNKLNDNPSNELKQLLTDLLLYGDAAYNYVNGTTGETPATSDVENLGTASDATPTTTDFTLVNATLPEGESYGAWFKGATVHFYDVNKIYVYVSSTENVTVKVNGEEVATSTVIKTDALIATDFDETFTFELYYNGTLMQTLTYSVNAYAYAMQNDATTGNLALALYRYGVSAEAYKASLKA